MLSTRPLDKPRSHSFDHSCNKMPREMQRSAEEEARLYYLRKMEDYVSNNFDELCNNMFGVREKHVELRFEAVDILRKKSLGSHLANTWKLERDINEHYVLYLDRLRKRNSFSE